MVDKFYQNKRILITGATGFKGAWLTMILIMYGAKILGLGFRPNKNQNLFDNLKLKKKIKFEYIDIRDYSKLEKSINLFKPQIVFHLAAQPIIFESYKKPLSTININSVGTLNLLEILKKTKSIKSIVCVTSDKCYANNFSTTGFKEDDQLGGSDPYSASKACAEIIINAYYKSFFKKKKIGLASARAGNVIGGGDWSPNRLIPDTINSLMNKKKIDLRNPGFNRPWQHVLEPLNGYLILAKKLYLNPKNFSGPWNFGSKRNTVTSVYEVVKQIVDTWGTGKITVKKNYKYYEQKNLQLNISKSQNILKWQPIYSIKKSISTTVDWYINVCKKNFSPEEITRKQIREFFKHEK